MTVGRNAVTPWLKSRSPIGHIFEGVRRDVVAEGAVELQVDESGQGHVRGAVHIRLAIRAAVG